MNDAKLLAIRDAVVAHWLRHRAGPNVEQLAAALNLSAAKVRTILRATCAREWAGIDESQVPGCRTHPRGSWGGRGNGSYPTTWTPTIELLTALLRGEGQPSKWRVRVSTHGGWTTRHDFEVVATSEAAALDEALARVEALGHRCHPNHRPEVEWLGRVEEGTPA